MKNKFSLLVILSAATGLMACAEKEQQSKATAQSPCDTVNQLTGAEKAAGWELLFDGMSLNNWHGYNGQGTQFWKIENCALKTIGVEGNYGSDKRADLVTDNAFENFEIVIDWKASKGGNSGIMYGVVEDRKYEAPWMTGPEYQFIDKAGFPEKLEEWQKAGADYAMHPPSATGVVKPVGEWNSTRILVNGTHVEHWLNGVKIVEFERWTDEWKRLRGSGKWKDQPDYGLAKSGRIALQDHGSIFWFRNIKIHKI